MSMTDVAGGSPFTIPADGTAGFLIMNRIPLSTGWLVKFAVTFPVLIILLCLTGISASFGQRREKTVVRERTEWTNVWMPNADNSDVPRVLLIGNSITQGYYPFVAGSLGESVNVTRFTTSSSIGDPVFFEEIKVYLKHYDFAAIHFNNGLHGVHLDSMQYERGIIKLLKYLRKYEKGAVLIAATTTRVMPGFPHWGTDEENLKLVEERNRVLIRVCSVSDIPVNDLFSLTQDQPGWFSADKIHYNETGNRALGRQVASAISVSLGRVKE